LSTARIGSPYRSPAAQAAPVLSAAQFLEGWQLQGSHGKSGQEAEVPKLRLARDTQQSKKGPASLLVSTTEGYAEGTYAKTVPVPPGGTDQPWVIGGWIKAAGNLETAQVSLRCAMSKGGTWKLGINAPEVHDWMEFSRAILIPAGSSLSVILSR